MAKKENTASVAALELRAIGDLLDLKYKLAGLAVRKQTAQRGGQVPARITKRSANIRRNPEPE